MRKRDKRKRERPTNILCITFIINFVNAAVGTKVGVQTINQSGSEKGSRIKRVEYVRGATDTMR